MKLLKNIKYTVSLIAITMLFGACNEYIEETIYSDITSENLITEDTADQLVVGIYTQVRTVYRNYGYKFYGTDIFTTKSDVTSFSSANDYFGLQRLLLSVKWKLLASFSTYNYFNFEALVVYVLKWQFARIYLISNSKPSVQEIVLATLMGADDDTE